MSQLSKYVTIAVLLSLFSSASAAFLEPYFYREECSTVASQQEATCAMSSLELVIGLTVLFILLSPIIISAIYQYKNPNSLSHSRSSLIPMISWPVYLLTSSVIASVVGIQSKDSVGISFIMSVPLIVIMILISTCINYAIWKMRIKKII